MEAPWNSKSPSALAEIATGRRTGLFAQDYTENLSHIAEVLRGARVLLIGGAGTIGGSVTRLLATFHTSALHVVDSNENALVELTRDLRASGVPIRSDDIRWLPLDFGSQIMTRWLLFEAPYDFVLNFAALKHVRSEKDICSALRILETNVLMQADLLAMLRERNRETHYFSVSTDKAANPVNLMGASKRLMEHVMFCDLPGSLRCTTSARFANVAFSDGSLLCGWLNRIAKAQPLAVPSGTRRFFVSIDEAGQLCMLAAFCQGDRRILVPRVSSEMELKDIESIAITFIETLGYEPVIHSDESEAIEAVSLEVARGRYPILRTALDTSGEKSFEEFVGRDEQLINTGLLALQSIQYAPSMPARELSNFLRELRNYIASPRAELNKEQLIARASRILPEFGHVETGRQLDDRV